MLGDLHGLEDSRARFAERLQGFFRVAELQGIRDDINLKLIDGADGRYSAVTFRVMPEPWQKLQWLADVQGVTRPGLLRQLIGSATMNVKAPTDREIEGIKAGEWKAWQSLADARGVSASELVRDIMERVTSKAGN